MPLGVALVLTLSDSAAAGNREDLSGPVAARILEEDGFEIRAIEILPDDRPSIEARLLKACNEGIRLIVTTGGTGLSPRDVTPEATLAVIDKSVPGISELMRSEGFKKTPRAALSRGVAGVRQSTLIINLPGSVKGVRECLGAVRPILAHAVETLQQSSLGCGE
jgi:molybdenum cofactor synthesis domain-containing protein